MIFLLVQNNNIGLIFFLKGAEDSGVHQSENQRQDPEREEGEGGGGYNKNGGTEPYQERETLSILYLNAQSIISKLNELQVVSKDLNPSIILVTESWCNNSIYDSTISRFKSRGSSV